VYIFNKQLKKLTVYWNFITTHILCCTKEITYIQYFLHTRLVFIMRRMSVLSQKLGASA
jgi:hypothetical protein